MKTTSFILAVALCSSCATLNYSGNMRPEQTQHAQKTIGIATTASIVVAGVVYVIMRLADPEKPNNEPNPRKKSLERKLPDFPIL